MGSHHLTLQGHSLRSGYGYREVRWRSVRNNASALNTPEVHTEKRLGRGVLGPGHPFCTPSKCHIRQDENAFYCMQNVNSPMPSVSTE